MAASEMNSSSDRDFTAEDRFSGVKARRSRISTGVVLWFKPKVINVIDGIWMLGREPVIARAYL